MKITLRKAAQLVTEITKRIGELTEPTEVIVTPNAAIAAEDIFVKHGSKFVASLGIVAELTRIQFAIRGMVCLANAESGVSKVLTEDAYVNSEIRRLAGLTANANVSLGLEAFKVEYNGVVARMADPAADRYYSAQNVRLPLLTEDVNLELAGQLLALKRSHNALTDQLLHLNTTTKVEIQDKDWDTLTTLGVA